MSSLHSPSTTRRSTPSRRGRAGLAVAAVMAAVTPLAAACGAGFDSAALNVKPNAGAGQVGTVRVNNVWVVVDPDTGNAEVIGAVANSGDSDLSWPAVQVGDVAAQIRAASDAGSASIGTSSSASASATASASGGSAAAASPASGIPAGQAVSFGEPGAPQIELSNSDLKPGGLTQVTFSFGSAGTVAVTAQIQSNTGLFADYNPNAPVAASGSASATAGAFGGAGSAAPTGANATSSAVASSSASASASPTASPSAS